MPITLPVETRRIGQAEFGEIAYQVMKHVFDIHDYFDRFFEEKFYKRELRERMDGVSLEVPITVSHESFSKQYSMDVLVQDAGIFEFKAAEAIHSRHRGQTLNYLLLADLAHAKIVNVRSESVGHEFVNCTVRRSELRQPTVNYKNWDSEVPGAERFRELLSSLVADWGSGLELPLYDAALCHFLQGVGDIEVRGSRGILGIQPMRLAAPSVAFKLTAMTERNEAFADHASRFLARTSLDAILWANMTQTTLRFEVLSKR